LAGSPPQIVRDAHGIAVGGVRLPDVAVPTARNDGVGNGLLGHHQPFSAETIRRLYPTREDYVRQVAAAARACVEAGTILPRAAETYIAAAQSEANAFDPVP